MKINITKQQKNVIISVSLLVVVVVFSLVFIFNKKDQSVSKFYSKQKRLSAISEEKVEDSIGDYCVKRRQEIGKLYSLGEMIGEIKKASGTLEMIGNTIEIDGDLLAGAREIGGNLGEIGGDYYLLDVGGKNIKLECFEFDKRVIVAGEGTIEIGYSNFKNIKGNALSIINGTGTIHHNRIIGAEKSGLYVEKGVYEIFNNIVKDGLSYGVYGGVEAALDLHENFIDSNGGYEVRLLDVREVYE